MKKLQHIVTLVIDVEYDEAKASPAEARTEAYNLAARPNFHTISNGVQLSRVTVMEDGKAIMYEDANGINYR